MKASCTSTKEKSMEAAFGDVPKTFMNASSQTTEDFNITFLTRSDSSDMIVDSAVAATTINPETTHTTGSTSLLSVASYICLRFYRLSTSHSRCSICDADFFGNSSTLVFSNDIRARAHSWDMIYLFHLVHECCDKHISADYLKSRALQRIRNKENKCNISVEEFINIFNIIKNEYLLTVSATEDFSKAPPLNFDEIRCLTSDNYYVLTDLSRTDFDNLTSRIPSSALKNTHNRSARTAIACLLMKLRLGISHQVLATLLSLKGKHTVSHVIHSAHKAIVQYFVLYFLGLNHITRNEAIDLYTCPLASEL